MKKFIAVFVFVASAAGLLPHDQAVKVIAAPIALYIAWLLVKRWARWQVDRKHLAMRREFMRARQRRDWEES